MEEWLKKLINEVPDSNDCGKINYWVQHDNLLVYLEGWCDECLVGTGFPTMERGEYEEKVNYISDLTLGILANTVRERKFWPLGVAAVVGSGNLKKVSGGFTRREDADHLYGVTWGVFKVVT